MDDRWRTSSQAYGAFYKLPPRNKVRDVQRTLLEALAPSGKTTEAKPSAQPQPEPSGEDKARFRTVPQLGDGSCLFHSLAHGTSADATR